MQDPGGEAAQRVDEQRHAIYSGSNGLQIDSDAMASPTDRVRPRLLSLCMVGILFELSHSAKPVDDAGSSGTFLSRHEHVKSYSSRRYDRRKATKGVDRQTSGGEAWQAIYPISWEVTHRWAHLSAVPVLIQPTQGHLYKYIALVWVMQLHLSPDRQTDRGAP